MGGGRPKRPPRGGPPGGPEETKIIFPLVVERLRVASLTQAFKEVLIKEELKTQLVKLVVTAALNEKKKAAFKKEPLLVADRQEIIIRKGAFERHLKIYGELETAIRTELVRRGLFEVDTLPQRLLVEAGDGPEAMSPGGPESTEAGPRDTVHFVVGVSFVVPT